MSAQKLMFEKNRISRFEDSDFHKSRNGMAEEAREWHCCGCAPRHLLNIRVCVAAKSRRSDGQGP